MGIQSPSKRIREKPPISESAFLFIFVLLLPLLPFVGCSKARDESTQDSEEILPPRVIVSVPMEMEESWKHIVSLRPLPAEYTWKNVFIPRNISPERESDEIGIPHILLSLRSYKLWMEKTEPDGELYHQQVYLPITNLSDPGKSISLDQVTEYPMLTPQEVRLPHKALKVEGKQIDHPEYPLQEKTYLTWEILAPPFSDENAAADTEELEKKKTEKLRVLFAQWLDQVKTAFPVQDTPPVFRIALVGDIMPGRGTDAILLSEGGVKKVFGSTLEVLREHHLVAGNLETVVTTGGEPFPKSYNFRVLPSILGKLKEAGFLYFSLTNNHCWDFYEEGFLDTLKHLSLHNIGFSGAGKTLAEAQEFWGSPMPGQGELQILSMGAYPRERNGFSGVKEAKAGHEKPGILWADEDGFQALESMANGKGPDDFIMVLVHGGHEWENKPRPQQQKTYRQFIDLGADAVIGSHPHVLQGLETYREKLIAYSLGNFIFPGMDETTYGEESLILSLGIHGNNVLYCDFYPVQIQGRTIALDETDTILPRFTALIDELE